MKVSIDLENAISEFLERSSRLFESPFSAHEIFEELAVLYATQRIDGAQLEYNGDMILVEWGQVQKVETLPSGPIDDRKYDPNGGTTRFSDDKFPSICFTRQVHVSGEDEDDFDGNAIGMFIRMYFEPGDLERGNHWVDMPDKAVEFQSVLKRKDDLNGLWKTPTASILASVHTIG